MMSQYKKLSTTIPRLMKASIAALVLATMTFSSGCADHQPQVLLIHYNMANTTATSGCAVGGAGLGVPAQTWGIMDLDLTDIYRMSPIIENRMLPSLSQTTSELLSEAHVATITGVYLSYRHEGLNSLQGMPDEIFQHAPGTLIPGSVGVWDIQAIPSSIGKLLQQASELQERYSTVEFIIDVTIEAVLLDGRVVRSNKFSYPVWLCRGCLTYNPGVDCASDAADATPPCVIGQDEGVDCRICNSLFQNSAICNPGPLGQN